MFRTLADLNALVERVTCRLRDFRTGHMGDGYYVQVSYMEDDVHTGEPALQLGRKWYVDPEAGEMETLQTILLAVLVSREHEIRENLLVDGKRVFNPHFSLDALLAALQVGEETHPDHVAR